MEFFTEKDKDPVVSYHFRSTLLTLLILVPLFFLSLFLMGKHYTLRIEHETKALENQFRERVDRLDSLLGAVTNRVKEMQLIAKDKLTEAYPILEISQVQIVNHIEDSQDGSYFHLDNIKPPYSYDTLGNLTGNGSFSDRDSDFYKEIYMALNLFSYFRATMKTIHSNAWGYYVSAKNFEAIYPWVSSKKFRFSKDNYKHPYYFMATPENNPGRRQFWTEMYVDDYGKGLMTTCGIPIYEEDTFLGVIDLDLTVDFLNKKIGEFDLRNGSMFIINAKNQVIAHSEQVFSDQNQIYTFNDVLPKALLDNNFRPDLLPVGRVVKNGSYAIVKRRMTNAPWQAIYYEKIPGFSESFFQQMGSWTAIVFGFIIAIIITSFVLEHKSFILPTKHFIEYIILRSSGNSVDYSAKLPQFWQSWYTLVKRTFNENEKLTREVQEQNVFLDKKVMERTAELEKTNQRLKMEINERKQAEEKLSREKAFSDAAIASLPGIFYVYDEHGKFLRWNHNLETISGYSDDQIARMLPDEFLPPDERVYINEAVREVFATGWSSLEANFMSKDGSLTPYLLTGARFEIGGMLCLAGMGLDISERKRTEETLQARELFFDRVIDQSPIATWISDAEGTLQRANPALKRFLNLTDEQLVGKYNVLEDTVAERQGLQPLFRTVFEEGKTINFYCEWDGNDIPTMDLKGSNSVSIEGTMFPIHSPEGKLTNVVLNWMDITERKQLEEQLRQSHKMEAVGTLTGGIAHDFNNILGIIVGNTELALEDVAEWNPAHFNLKKIKTAGLKAAGIVKQLLSFSRKTEQKLKPIKISTVIQDTLKLLRSTIPTTIEIRINIPDADDTILADPIQINQVMMNLCINASHEMEQTGGILEITVENRTLDEEAVNDYPDLTTGDYVKISVGDTGSGIDPEIIDNIYDPYFTTKEVGKGSGLGLAVVHGIVKNHSGAITVESEPGKGTTFSILFPVTIETPELEIETATPPP